MQGFLWLILQMALLLLAAAVVFFSLGWYWRGQNGMARIAELDSQIDAESSAAEAARKDRDAALAALEQVKAAQMREAADLQEALDRQRGLEREILRLADDLKAAKSQIREPEPVKVQEIALSVPIQTESEAATQPEASLESAHEASFSEEQPLPTESGGEASMAQDTAAKTAPPAKEPKPRKTSAAPSKSTRTVNGRNVLKRLEKSLAAQAATVETLRAKRDLCQVRLDELQTQKDRVGLRTATKNLTQKNRELAEAVQSMESRQRQVRAISRSLESMTTLGKEDDLTRIKGIKGPVNDQLRTLGIRTYRQISQWTDEEAEAFGELLAIKKHAARDLWRAQARELHQAAYGNEPA